MGGASKSFNDLLNPTRTAPAAELISDTISSQEERRTAKQATLFSAGAKLQSQRSFFDILGGSQAEDRARIAAHREAAAKNADVEAAISAKQPAPLTAKGVADDLINKKAGAAKTFADTKIMGLEGVNLVNDIYRNNKKVKRTSLYKSKLSHKGEF